MNVLRNRVVPPGIYTNITSTNLGEAINGLLVAAQLPSRRTKLYRVLFNNRPLWLAANRTTFKTRASAKNAVLTWLANGLHDVTASALNNGMWQQWQHIYQRLGFRPQDHNFYYLKQLLGQHVDALFTAGVLRYEIVDLDNEAPDTQESLVS